MERGLNGREDYAPFLLDVLKGMNTEYAVMDIWASWCKPCLTTMSAAREFREKNAGQVSYLYLSIENQM